MLLQTDFPVLSYSLHNLAEFAIMILKESQYCNNQEKQLMTKILVHLIASNYNIISYHNFSHAFSLMQVISVSLSSTTNVFFYNHSSVDFTLPKSSSTSWWQD